MIGHLIQQRLDMKGWNQSQLAVHAGLSQAYISKLVRGQVRLPNQGTLKKIGAQLSISLSEFYQAAGLTGIDANGLASDDNPLGIDFIPYIETWSDLASRLKAIRDANPGHYEKLVTLLRQDWRAQAEHTIGLYELLQMQA